MSTEYQQKNGVAVKQSYWQQHIEDCRRGQENQHEYCSKHGLALSTFCYWKKKLKGSGQKSPHFYPLTVQSVSQHNAQSAGSGLFLKLAGGKFQIELTDNFSATCLKKLILTLEQL